MKPWYASRMREALRMARAHAGNRHMRVIWQERAADYRETLIDAIRREAGWTLSERLIGRKPPINSEDTMKQISLNEWIAWLATGLDQPFSSDPEDRENFLFEQIDKAHRRGAIDSDTAGRLAAHFAIAF